MYRSYTNFSFCYLACLYYSEAILYMIATLLKKNNNYLCGNCLIKQPEPFNSFCIFCGRIFRNYEEELLKIYREEQKREVENDKING